MRWAKLRTSCCLSLAKLSAVVEPVEGDFSILADLDDVAVGITHVAAPFPAVIVLMARKLFTLFRSDGVSRRTSGLSGVGPPQELRMIHVFASLM